MPERPHLADLLAGLRQFLLLEFGYRAEEIRIKITDRAEPFCMPFPAESVLSRVPESDSGSASTGASQQEPFVLTVFQRAILEALEGRALRTRALGAAVGDESRLYKPGGLKELREHGLVKHHSRLGFYRVDAPPEELSNTSSE